MSPELFKYKPYSYKSDIWALGCVLYEVCNLKHAFTAQTLNGLAVKILKGNYMPISMKYSKQLRDLIMSMLNTNPKKRPTIQDILNVPTIKKKLVHFIINLHKNAANEDDLYLETVKEQCVALGIEPLVQKYMNKSMPPNQNEFTKDESEKLKEQKRLKELELKQSLKARDDLERKIEALEKKIKDKSLVAKDKVLYEKEQRKLKEIKKREEELEKIRYENEKERNLAKQKFNTQYRESKNVKNLLQQDPLSESYNSDFEGDGMDYEENDFQSSGNINKIVEVNEDDEYETEGDGLAELESYRKKLEDNTQNIKKLQEDLKETTRKLNYDLSVTENQPFDEEIDAISQETPFNISDLEESEEEGSGNDTGNYRSSLGKYFEGKIKDLEM